MCYTNRGAAFLGTTEIGVSLSHHLQKLSRGEHWVVFCRFFGRRIDVLYCCVFAGSTIQLFLLRKCRSRVHIVEAQKNAFFVFGHNGFIMYLGCTWDVLGMLLGISSEIDPLWGKHLIPILYKFYMFFWLQLKATNEMKRKQQMDQKWKQMKRMDQKWNQRKRIDQKWKQMKRKEINRWIRKETKFNIARIQQSKDWKKQMYSSCKQMYSNWTGNDAFFSVINTPPGLEGPWRIYIYIYIYIYTLRERGLRMSCVGTQMHASMHACVHACVHACMHAHGICIRVWA